MSKNDAFVKERQAHLHSIVALPILYGKWIGDNRTDIDALVRKDWELMKDRKSVTTNLKKTMEGLNATLRHCHNLYNKFSENQNELAQINQAAKDAIKLIQELEAYKDIVFSLLDVGYPHNFQREEPWIRNYCYKITGVVKMAYDAVEEEEK